MAVFGGSIGTSGSVTFQVGAGSTSLDTISVSLTSVGSFSSAGIAGASIGSIGTSSTAITAIGVLDDAIDGIAQLRSTLGATINQT